MDPNAKSCLDDSRLCATECGAYDMEHGSRCAAACLACTDLPSTPPTDLTSRDRRPRRLAPIPRIQCHVLSSPKYWRPTVTRRTNAPIADLSEPWAGRLRPVDPVVRWSRPCGAAPAPARSLRTSGALLFDRSKPIRWRKRNLAPPAGIQNGIVGPAAPTGGSNPPNPVLLDCYRPRWNPRQC
jgi:hypothetical protein